MQRSISAMGEAVHDLLVVGGGVCGACIARDAAMRGLSVALVERNDFAHATSAASSKLIHGGLRYLKNLELSLVRESLRERRAWEVIAPHLVYPLAFVLPAYRGRGSSKRWVLRAGLTIYDLLGYDRNRLDDEDRKLPGHSVLSAEEAQQAVPALTPEGLVGALRYWDCQMFSPERLALECVIDATAHGAKVANHASVRSFLVEHGAIQGALVHDELGDQDVEIRARAVVNATGPWADRLLGSLDDTPTHTITRSKGIHVITRPLTKDVALVLESKGRHMFVLPWRGRSLIGTTDVVYAGDPDDFRVTESDIVDFLAEINDALPSAQLSRDDVEHFYGGLRPLVESSPGEGSYNASRRAEVVDHGTEGGPRNLFSALGGKWTTSRALAEQVVDAVMKDLGLHAEPCHTHERPLPGGGFGSWAAFLAEQVQRHPELPAEVVEHLARNYGARLPQVLALAQDEPSLAEPIVEGRLERKAEVVFAVRHEMACSLSDVMLRRTGLATLGDPGAAVTEAVAELVGAERGWSDDERARQIADLHRAFEPAE